MSLLEWRRPSNVAGFVIPVRINAVERHSRGARAYFLENGIFKHYEIVKPRLAHFDAFAAPVFVAIAIWISRSFFDRLPRVVERSTRALWRVAVLQCMGVSARTARFATTFGVAASQVGDANEGFGPAVASAKPYCSASVHVRKADRGQLPKALTRDIKATHGDLRQGCSVKGRPERPFSGRPAHFSTGALSCG